MDMKGHTLVIDSGRDGQRIDNFLITKLKGVPKSLIYRLIRTGKIRVNGKRVKQTYRLVTDDSVSVPELRLSQQQNNKPVIDKRIQDLLASSIIYEDEQILVINKPAGMAVHPGTGVSYGVIEILRELRPAAPYLELVHRLDRETSGCLLIAKSKSMLNELHDLLKTQNIHKEYLAVLKGRWLGGDRVVETPLRDKARGAIKSDFNGKLRDAITTFSPVKIYDGFSVVHVKIGTGRTHQIRIHAAQLEHPVVGDQKYGDFSFNRACRKLGIKRMLLHASKIAFQLPDSGLKYNFVAPVDENFEGILNIISTPMDLE